MKVNWKIRFKNPTFLFQLFLTFLLPILAYNQMTTSDLTSWGAFFNVLKGAISNPFLLGTIAVGLWNAINDPTVKGVINDSEQALNYEEPKDNDKYIFRG